MFPRRALAILSLVLLLVMAACGGPATTPPPPGGGPPGGGPPVDPGDPDPPPEGRARLEGRLIVAGATPPAGAPDLRVPLEDVVPGEVLVGFRDAVAAQASGELRAAGLALQRERAVGLTGWVLYRAAGADRAATLAAAAALEARREVAWAVPNRLLHPQRLEPDDPFYPLQWHYPGIGLPDAWEITTGSADVVVAVLDTGILVTVGDDAATHPDLLGRTLPGADFITDPRTAGDGDGRDADPFDPGDGTGTFHGSHVAGTIGAASNDGAGAAGVAWGARLLPVRVLGNGGGTLLDIVEAALWAGGLLPGTPNATPAQVLNLSLGGPGLCSAFEQQAFDALRAAGVIVVVAAGNANANAGGFTPASCAGVITVGATDRRDVRAPYSNYGSRIDVMAPGGDMSADVDGDGRPDGVLSLGFDLTSGQFGWFFQNGTSMAAPHVAGLIALMMALDPGLDYAAALGVLRATAVPLGAAACTGRGDAGGGPLAAGDCGAGRIDALAALQAVQAGGVPAPGELAPDPALVDFGAEGRAETLTLRNVGAATLAWELEAFEPAADNPGPVQDGVLQVPAGTPLAGALAPGEEASLELRLDRGRAPAPGAYRLDLLVRADGATLRVPVRFTVAPGEARLSGPTVVVAFRLDAAGDPVVTGFVERPEPFERFRLDTEPGELLVAGWSDVNDDLEVNSGDYLGLYDGTVVVAAGDIRSDLDVLMERVLEIGAADRAVVGAVTEALRARPATVPLRRLEPPRR